MAKSWMQMAATDAGVLAGVLLVASRHLSTLKNAEIYANQALKYKTECIRMLNLALSLEGQSVSDATILKTLALASDAVSLDLLVHEGLARNTLTFFLS